MATVIINKDLKRIPGNVKPDSKKRVVLPKSLIGDDIIYHIYYNSFGQIVLDPQVTIPASELWLFKNKKALAMIDEGMAEEEVINRGSFAEYIEDAS